MNKANLPCYRNGGAITTTRSRKTTFLINSMRSKQPIETQHTIIERIVVVITHHDGLNSKLIIWIILLYHQFIYTLPKHFRSLIRSIQYTSTHIISRTIHTISNRNIDIGIIELSE